MNETTRAELNAVSYNVSLAWTSFEGAQSAQVLNGLVTNDVAALATGSAQIALALSPKGKLVCDMIIVRSSDELFLVGVDSVASASWLGLVRKYVNPRLSKYQDESAKLSSRIIVGPDAARAGATITPSESALCVAQLTYGFGPNACVVVSTIDQIVNVDNGLEQLGVFAGSDNDWAVTRVEAGWPAMNVDMNDSTLPQEANLDRLGAISFTKGCYTGQETVARIHFRGHVNRHLRGLKSAQLLEVGAAITDADGKEVGDVRSAVHSPKFGFIALGMVRRELSAGDTVTVSNPSGAVGETSAVVAELPFDKGA